MREKSKAEIAAEAVSNFVNSYSNDNSEFIRLMERDHPTLQQSFTRLCLEWIERVAEEDYATDGRNITSRQVARDLLRAWEEKYPSMVPSKWLPLV